MKNSSKPHLKIQIAPLQSGAGPRFSAQTEETIEWFRRTILQLNESNRQLRNELILYRSVCRFFTLLIALAVVASIAIYPGEGL
jgi:hypothetical protein